MNLIGVDYGIGNDIAMVTVMSNMDGKLDLVENCKVEEFDYSKYVASDHQIVGGKSDLEKFKSYLENLIEIE